MKYIFLVIIMLVLLASVSTANTDIDLYEVRDALYSLIESLDMVKQELEVKNKLEFRQYEAKVNTQRCELYCRETSSYYGYAVYMMGDKVCLCYDNVWNLDSVNSVEDITSFDISELKARYQD